MPRKVCGPEHEDEEVPASSRRVDEDKHDTHNCPLGSKLSSFLNYFCPPSAPELRGWLRPAGLPALIVAAFTRRVQF